MNTTNDMERQLRAMLRDTAPRREPDALYEAVLAQTRAVRQRPGLLVGLWSGDVAATPRTTFRLAQVVLTGLLIAAILGAAAIAYVASRRDASPAADSILATGSMSVGRVGAAAVRLTDGRVLVVGGWTRQDNGVPALAGAEIYDPVSGAFMPTGSMSEARVQASATLLPDGRVLVAGGYPVAPISGGGPSDALASAEVFDPVAGTFSPTGSMHEGRAGHVAHALASGQVLLAGGIGGTIKVSATERTVRYPTTIELFDPLTGTFGLAKSEFPHGQEFPNALDLPDGRVLITGYFDLLAYDPATRVLKDIGQADVEGSTATLLADGQVLLTSNGPGSPSWQLLDAASGTVRSIPGPDWPTERAALLDDGRVVSFGASPIGSPRVKVEVYDPATGLLAESPEMAYAHGSGYTVTRLLNGSVLIAGGWGNLPETITTGAELFIPGTVN